jgi:CrcB protein
MVKILLLIGAGGFIGSVSRFLASRYIQSYFLSAFPFGTLVVNVTGCLLIGIFYGLIEKGSIFSPEIRMFVTVGFCGGFTTFSAFSSENMAFLRDGDFFRFMIYTVLSVFLGLMAIFIGNIMANNFLK